MLVSLDPHLCDCAAHAADEILAEFLRIDLSKARRVLDPLKFSDFMVISKRIASRLKSRSLAAQAPVLRKTLDTLNVDWPNITSAQRQRVIAAARASIRRAAPRATAAVTASLRTQSTPLVRSVRDSVRKTFRVNIGTSLTAFDQRVAEYAWSSQGNFVSQFYTGRAEVFSGQARSIVANGLERGLGREEITRNLRATMYDGVKRSDAYLEVIAATFANRARTFAQIGTFAEAGIQAYRWESVLDEVTTETCRFLHDKVFSTGDALSHFERVESEDYNDPESMKELSPWMREGKDPEGNRILFTQPTPDHPRTTVATIDRPSGGGRDAVGAYSTSLSNKELSERGLSLPPIHGLCRSTVVPDDTLATGKPAPSPAAAPRIPDPRVPGERKEFAQQYSRALNGIERWRAGADTAQSIASQREARRLARRHLGGYGMTSKDGVRDNITSRFLRDEQAGLTPDAVRVVQVMPDGCAYHNWQGTVAVRADHMEKIKAEAAEFAASPKKFAARAKTNPSVGDAISTMFHEEIHGMSAITSDAYPALDSFGAALEEATTELLAKRATRDLIGVRWSDLPAKSPLRPPRRFTFEAITDPKRATAWIANGSYRARVSRLFAAYERALGKPLVEGTAAYTDAVDRLERAAMATRSRPPIGPGSNRIHKQGAATWDFAKQPALGLTEAQRTVFNNELLKGLDVIDDVALYQPKPAPVLAPKPAPAPALVEPGVIIPPGGRTKFFEHLNKQLAILEDSIGASSIDEVAQTRLNDAARKQRKLIRAHLNWYDMQTKSIHDGGSIAMGSRVYMGDMALQGNKAIAFYFNGGVFLDNDVVRDARSALKRLSASRASRAEFVDLARQPLGVPGPSNQFSKTAKELNALVTLIHEEVHGYSALAPTISRAGATQGSALALEEATTEMIARRATRDMLNVRTTDALKGSRIAPPRVDRFRAMSGAEQGKMVNDWSDFGGTYSRQTSRLMAAYERARGVPIKTEAEWLDAVTRIEDASIATRSRAASGANARRYQTTQEAVRDFVDQPKLGLTKQQRDQFFRELHDENALDGGSTRGIAE